MLKPVSCSHSYLFDEAGVLVCAKKSNLISQTSKRNFLNGSKGAFLVGIFVLLLFLFSVNNLYGIENGAARQIVLDMTPSVVHLESKTEKQLGFPGRPGAHVQRIEETGSGVIIELGGKHYVLTNRHIIANTPVDSVRVHLSDRRVLRPIRGVSNADFDIALLEINAENLVAAKIGNSDAVEIPDDILTFGSPFGLNGSVSKGIIAAKNRRKIPQGEQTVPIQGFFQTDAAINPGCSGGPMVNEKGEVIGIITAIASSGGSGEGVAFAIPINRMIKVAKELAETGTVVRPYLGIELDPKFDFEQGKNSGLDREIGTRIERTNPNSPGERVGLLPGDIIISYNGITVEDDVHLVLLIAQSEVGDTPKLEVLRDKTKLFITPRLAGNR